MRRDAGGHNINDMETSVEDIHVRALSKGETADISRVDARHGADAATSPSSACSGLCFHALECAYESAGGSVSGEQLVQRLRAWSDQPISMLAHWIVDREIVLINRQGRTLIPNFQFMGPRCSRRPEVANVIAELRSAYDDLELATWFVTPNTWLDEALPVKLINRDARRVFEAARVDRFVACG